MRNESLRDYAGVVVRVWSWNSQLLSEHTEIVGTTHVLNWTHEFSSLLTVPESSDPTESQVVTWHARRDYLVPTFNRGQIVRLVLLNSAMGDDDPEVLLDIQHPGVRLEYREVTQQFWGVPHNAAALVGTLTGGVVVGILAQTIDSLPLVVALSYLYGVIVVAPGALLVRAWRWLRSAAGD